MKEFIESIQKGIEVRANLIQLKQQLKEASDIDAFLQCIDWNMNFFRILLADADAKVRKNIVQIIGICKLDGLADDIFVAYQEEKILYVRPEYLKVLKKFEAERYLPYMEMRAEEIRKMGEDAEKEKHIGAELRILTAILKQYGKVKAHTFIGGDVMSTMILTSLSGKEKYLKRAVDQRIGEGKTTLVRGGVKVMSSDYENLMKVRCFQEMLFVVPGLQQLSGNPSQIAEQMIKAGILSYLQERMSGNAAFGFRVEARGIEQEEERGKFVKKVSQELERCSGHQLVNVPSDYEITLRFHKSNKIPDRYALYLKISVIPDTRFDYRKNSLPSSIQPYLAALIMEIIQDYTKGRGQVLDPFCGVGTMLMERNYKEHAHSLYGVDIYGQAVCWANEHARQARMDIHYIQKDMADFTHDYLFDLIITNLPAATSRMEEERVAEIYNTFLLKCTEWLQKDGIVVVYTQSPTLLEEAIQHQSCLKVITQTEMYKNGKSKLYIMK